MLARLATLHAHQKRLGTWGCLVWRAVTSLDSRNAAPKTVRMPCRQLKHPIKLRTGGSSDLDVFGQLIFRDELAFLNDLSDVQTMIDLGANIGLSSALVLSRFPRARVVAVEPDPENFRMMEQNLTLYGRDRVRLLQGAVWSKSGQVALDNTFGDKREWAVAVKAGNGVRAYSLDEILSGEPSRPIDLLKIDIEGSEKELFSGDTSWLSRIRNLCIELHGAACEKAFRSGTTAYKWNESKCGEYVVCQDMSPR